MRAAGTHGHSGGQGLSSPSRTCFSRIGWRLGFIAAALNLAAIMLLRSRPKLAICRWADRPVACAPSSMMDRGSGYAPGHADPLLPPEPARGALCPTKWRLGFPCDLDEAPQRSRHVNLRHVARFADRFPLQPQVPPCWILATAWQSIRLSQADHLEDYVYPFKSPFRLAVATPLAMSSLHTSPSYCNLSQGVTLYCISSFDHHRRCRPTNTPPPLARRRQQQLSRQSLLPWP